MRALPASLSFAILGFAAALRAEPAETTSAPPPRDAPGVTAAPAPVNPIPRPASGAPKAEASRAATTHFVAEEPDDVTETRWYGWQTLTLDGIAFAMTASAVALNSEIVGYTSVATYAVGAPIVHLVQGHPFKGLGSLGLRVGLPIAGAAIGTKLAASCGGDFGCIGEAFLGAMVGVGAAVTLDAALLAYDERPRRQASFAAMPFAYVDGRRALLGLGGRF